MLNFDDILSYYPKPLQVFRENILKEYLQHLILDVVYSSPYAAKLVFIGGTSVRIIHNSPRFSEDLDFDNFGITQKDFIALSQLIKRRLEWESYQVEIKNVFRRAFHCYIRFPDILFQNNLSGHREEKILIRLDTEAQHYKYQPEKFLINKFGIFRYVLVAPRDLLLSMKIKALLGRKREKGRDFFDVVYLFSKTKPDLLFLKQQFDIADLKALGEKLKAKSTAMNFSGLAKDVEPFLFDSAQSDRVLYFKDWLNALFD